MENQIKIMVVDDEIGICKNVEKILTKNNYSVVHTQSAAQALEMMKNGSFSILQGLTFPEKFFSTIIFCILFTKTSIKMCSEA